MTDITTNDRASVRPRRPREMATGLRQRAWWVIRRRITFTLPDLLSVLATGTERDAAGNLRKYLQALTRCGILSTDEKLAAGAALTSPGFLRYNLVINNGRSAPVWRVSRNTVYDPNNKTSYPIVKGGNDA